MPLRSAPLPRMAGHLTFMRARPGQLSALNAGDVGIVGVPLEDPFAPQAGQHLAPRALRETSVYFGWHRNAQFSHPVDIDARRPIDTSGLDERMRDLGDVCPPGTGDAGAHNALHDTLARAARQRASLIVLGGRDRDAPTFANALPGLSWIRLHNAPAEPAFHLTGAARLDALREWACGHAPLAVQFDLSVFPTHLCAMTDRPQLGGLDLSAVSACLAAIGQLPVSAMWLTGLNPTLGGMSTTKVGQRLMVTALLHYVYARLGLSVTPLTELTDA